MVIDGQSDVVQSMESAEIDFERLPLLSYLNDAKDELVTPVEQKKEVVTWTRISASDAEGVNDMTFVRAHDGYIKCSRSDIGQKQLSHIIKSWTFVQGFVVDHIDSQICNNTNQNLRIISLAENSRNKSKCSNASSKYFGVSSLTNWRAITSVGPKTITIGR